MEQSGLEKTVADLLEMQSKHGLDQVSLLVMLSLVNLMGIINILQNKAIDLPVEKASAAGTEKEGQSDCHAGADLMQLVQQAASGRINPAQLIGMLGNQGGQMPNSAALMGLLSQLMQPAPPVPPAVPFPAKERSKIQKKVKEAKDTSLGQEKKAGEKEECSGQSGQKPILKWDPRLG
ncbi:hypothetical protein [Desulfofalx alkaliphila]|uniref:hypothetical protein n=1 Tax=Desulfofalx alkaliphila TaxID=105483 RepID=UPI0004E14544|nr:hypothetical protein [Desulfofalx alkaliphila]